MQYIEINHDNGSHQKVVSVPANTTPEAYIDYLKTLEADLAVLGVGVEGYPSGQMYDKYPHEEETPAVGEITYRPDLMN